ncbi:uncharacterized protein BXZ73DRAFT_97548 [Epithele typhae]|uniref:uncharacterized protein n=1 Tax=Epithele typhae TaxID=378194 RepID=UPI002007C240|nr:uncharacterized protein BXZ73DRAFT_97548 [Epithele typhae]KAH9943509.1 hypothetical protein BXZ73DRAFT_97548 [Epithele typhae]
MALRSADPTVKTPIFPACRHGFLPKYRGWSGPTDPTLAAPAGDPAPLRAVEGGPPARKRTVSERARRVANGPPGIYLAHVRGVADHLGVSVVLLFLGDSMRRPAGATQRDTRTGRPRRITSRGTWPWHRHPTSPREGRLGRERTDAGRPLVETTGTGTGAPPSAVNLIWAFVIAVALAGFEPGFLAANEEAGLVATVMPLRCHHTYGHRSRFESASAMRAPDRDVIDGPLGVESVEVG